VGNWEQVVKQAAIKQVREAAKIRRFTGQTARWRRLVLERDGYRCLLCEGASNLEAHHLDRWYDAPLKRLKVTNGATLCRSCHRQHHSGNGSEFPKDVTALLRIRIKYLKVRPLSPLKKLEILSIAPKKQFVLCRNYMGITMPEFRD